MGGRVYKLRACLYADDAAVFLNPIKEEVQVVADILQMFGHASGLYINLNKCAVFPIRCSNINLEEVMEGFPCSIKNFPCSYLGLPLHTRELRRVDIQPLVDKVANRLPAWKGRFINRAGRLKLLNTVLTSLPVYFLTVFNPKKWMIKKIDRIRRGFLWNGTSEAQGGQCLVAWEKLKKPKPCGGLGVLDLEKFSRALRLRWMWYQWVDSDRPWVGTDVPCNELDKQLFRCSTVVTIGDGRKALFWDSPWLDGHAPRDVAPNLYKLAWRKKLTVREEVENQTWTRGLWRMTTATEMAEFVLMWEQVQAVQFSVVQDEIRWKWTANGHYSSKSAYDIQFAGSYCTFNSKVIWNAKTEGKHRFFAWLLVQEKLQTADNLLVKGIACDSVCCLCDQELETTKHLCLHCCFAQEVWALVHHWTDGLINTPTAEMEVEDWWNTSVQTSSAENRARVAALLIYIVWNIWNERNMRIFQGISQPAIRILGLIKEEMEVRRQGCEGRPAS